MDALKNTLARPPRQSATTIAIVLAAIVLFLWSWNTSEMNIPRLFIALPKTWEIISSLVQPDILARPVVSQKGNLPFPVPCGAEEAPPPQPSELRIVSSVPCASASSTIQIEAYGLHPGSDVFVRWRLPNDLSLSIGRFIADKNGHISAPARVTELMAEGGIGSIEVEGRREEGLPHPSPAFLLTLEKAVETIFMAMMATTLGSIIAIPLSFLGARNIMARGRVGTVIYYIVRTTFNLARSIEPIILAVVFAIWVGFGPFAGVLALSIQTISNMGKLFSEAVEGIDPGPVEAIAATGANSLQIIVYGIIPQIIPPFTSFALYQWDINVRMSTVIGFVGGGGIGFQLKTWIDEFSYHKAGTATWAIVAIVWIMDYASARMREKLV
jgi:phosphonate transport system permease protein